MCDCGECEDCTRAILINERDRRLAAEDREATLREKLAAAGAEKDAVLAGEATWIRKAAEYNDKMRAERAARVQAEAALSRARELLLAVDIEDPCGNSCLAYDFERAVTCSYQPHAGVCWAHRRDAFLADPANTPKEPTADGK